MEVESLFLARCPGRARIVGFAGLAQKAEVAMLATDENGPDLST